MAFKRSVTAPEASGNRTAPSSPRSPARQLIPGFNPRAEDRVAHILRQIPPVQLVIGAAAVSALIYLGFTLAFPLTTLWSHPHTANSADAINDLGRLTGYSPVAAVAFVLAILTLFACQFFALTAAPANARRGDPSAPGSALIQRVVLGMPLVFAAILIWMQPVTTTDLYGYVARGYLYAQLHLNPMIHAATALPGGLSVDRPPSPYGPAWLLVAWLFSRISGENLLLNMLLFKLTAFLALVGALWLVDYLARALFPERRLRIMVLFGWSPLVLFEAIGNGHNDIVMMVCVLGAFALMLRGHSRAAFTCFVVGALIKYVSAIFLPLWLVYELRQRSAPSPQASLRMQSADRRTHPVVLAARRWLRTAAVTLHEVDYRAATWLIVQCSSIGLALVAVCYVPFWAGLQTFTGLGQQIRPLYYNSSIVGFFAAPLEQLVSPAEQPALDKTIRLICYVIFACYAYLQIQRLWLLGRQGTLRSVITAAAKVTFAALLLITFWFQPWYVIWLVPLAALASEPFIRRQGMLLAAGALMTYAVSNYLFVQDSDFVRGLFVQFFEIIVVFGPLLLLRAAPYNQGWVAIVRRYTGLVTQGLTGRPVFWHRVMLALVVLVAALLRLVRLDNNLFTTIPRGNSSSDILRQLGGDLRLVLADPQGLHGPFAAVQNFLVGIFGDTPFAALLPSAIIGSLTVVAVYLLTLEILRHAALPQRHIVALLAALLVATSSWHVSLSRSGMEVVLLPLLMCMALYWLLLGLRAEAPPGPPGPSGQSGHPEPRRIFGLRSGQFSRLVGCGLCTGLASDLEPGLWLVPLTVAGFLLVWRWRRPQSLHVSRSALGVVTVTALVSGAPALWYYVNRVIGFPNGSAVLARTSFPPRPGPSPLSLTFWGQVLHNAASTLDLLRSQDFSAGYPSTGGTPIIPALLLPFALLGLVTIMRWRGFTSMSMLALIALPLVASVAVGTPTSVIDAASVLPALCIVPAIGLFTFGEWIGRALIVLDRTNGVRVFSSPERIGRIVLLIFLLVSTVRTFFWYFEATLPTPTQQWTPSLAPQRTALVAPAPARATGEPAVLLHKTIGGA